MVAGVYLITNKINDHKYVGGSVDIHERFRQHKNYSDVECSAIDKAIKKYGADNFTYQIITKLPTDWNIIGEHEKYWINFYNTFEDKKHYNLTKGGNGCNGYKQSQKTKNKKNMSISKKKNKYGFFGLTTEKHKDCKQGFRWVYAYSENGKQKQIKKTNLFKLIQKVKLKDLQWFIVDNEKVINTIRGIYNG